MELIVDYGEHLLNYYPEVIKQIREFQKLTEVQGLQIKDLHGELTKILANAYITTADEATIAKWEKMLDIVPLPKGDLDLDTWLNDRRETILARIYNVEKLNTKSISDIVKIFTGGTAQSYFKDSTLYVIITPPPGNKSYQFANVEQELKNKIPAHLGLRISRNYFTWQDIYDNFDNWQDVANSLATWEDVYLFVPFP